MMRWTLGWLGLLLLVSERLSLDQQALANDPSSWGSLRNWLPGSHSQVGVAHSGPWVSSGTTGKSRALPPLQPVALQCQEMDMVVVVQRDLFRTGKLVQAADLKLGAAFCKYTSLSAADNTVTFQIALQDCGNTLQVTPEFLVYSSILTYNPTPSGSTIITRTNPASVLVQCIYRRNANMSSNAIQPTWIPFSSTVHAEETLAFSLRLMNDNWSSVRNSTTFHLGDVFNIEASVQTGNHAAMRIFVDGCVATLTPDKNSSPQYDIIAANGCLVDGKISDSAFISPRVHPDQLQFTVDAFRFFGDVGSMIFITCSLRVVAADSAPDHVNKACSFRAGSGWIPVEGPTSICSCCDTGNCAPDGMSRLFPLPKQQRSEARDLAVGPFVILDEDLLQMDGIDQIGSVLGLQTELLESGVLQDEEYQSTLDEEPLHSQAGKLTGVVESRASPFQPLEVLNAQKVKADLSAWPEEEVVMPRHETDKLAALHKDHSEVPSLHMVLDAGIRSKDNLTVPQGPTSHLAPLAVQEHETQVLKLLPAVLYGQETWPKEDHKGQVAQPGPLKVLQEYGTGPKEMAEVQPSQIALLGQLEVLEHGTWSNDGQISQLEPLATEPKEKPKVPQVKISEPWSLEVLQEPISINDSPTVPEETKSMLGSQLVQIGPIVILNEENNLGSEEFWGPLAVQKEEPRKVLQELGELQQSLVHVGPITGLEHDGNTSDLAVPEPRSILGFKFQQDGPVGLVMELGKTHHPLTGQSWQEVEYTSVELQAGTLGGESGAAGEMSPTDVSRAAMTTPLSHHVYHQTMVVERPRRLNDGKAHAGLLEAKPEAEVRERLVEMMLLAVAGVVLVCMVLLGGFLVYRRRNQAFV